MRDCAVRPVHRIKGRPALPRSLAGLLVRVYRFGLHRATTPGDRKWAARVADAVAAALAAAREPDGRDPAVTRQLEDR